MRENREVPWSPVLLMVGSGREGNADGGNPLMHDHGKSDGLVVPAKPPNKTVLAVAEVVEGRRPVEGNAASETRPGLRAGVSVSSELDRVRRVARQDKDARFTALLHHVTVDRLRAAYRAISPNAAPGVDGVTWRDYGLDLEENLLDLHARVHRGAYRATPSRRVFIPKADGRQRPLGVASLDPWRPRPHGVSCSSNGIVAGAASAMRDPYTVGRRSRSTRIGGPTWASLTD
jgi:hypothetical protein